MRGGIVLEVSFVKGISCMLKKLLTSGYMDVFVFFLRKVKQNATVLKNQGNNKGLIRKWRSTSLTISYSHAHKSDSHSDDSSDHT